MVNVLTMLTNPSSYSSSPHPQLLIQPIPPSSSSVASPATSLRYKWCCMRESSRTEGGKHALITLTKVLRASIRRLTQCRSRNISSNSLMEIGILYPLFQEIGIEEREAQVLLDKNPALAFTSLESIRSRVHSLRSFRIDGLALCRLIAKRPDVLTAEEIDSLLSFIQDEVQGSIKPIQLERLLRGAEPRSLKGFGTKVRVLLQYGVPPEKLAHVLNNVNLTKVFCYKSAEEIERTIIFLNRFGGIDLIVRGPVLLNYDLESQLVPRIEFLSDLGGGDDNATGAVLRKLPAVLTYTVEHLEQHAEFLRSSLGLSDPEIFRIVFVYPNVFSASRKRKLHPRIEFLKLCGLNCNDIFRFLIKAPLFMGLSYEQNLSQKLGFLVKIGYENRTKELAVAIGAATRTSCENMQNVIGVFIGYGFSFEDILAMSRKHPQILQYNHKSLEKKIEYLVEELGREIEELLAFPAFLGYKLDDRIKHRYEEKRMTRGDGMSLNKLLTVSTARFLKKGGSVQMKHNLNGAEDKFTS